MIFTKVRDGSALVLGIFVLIQLVVVVILDCTKVRMWSEERIVA